MIFPSDSAATRFVSWNITQFHVVLSTHWNSKYFKLVWVLWCAVPASLSIHSHSFNSEAFTILQYTGFFLCCLAESFKKTLSAGNSGLQTQTYRKAQRPSENQEVWLPTLHLAWDGEDKVQILLQLPSWNQAVMGQEIEQKQQHFYLFFLPKYYHFQVTLDHMLNFSTKLTF